MANGNKIDINAITKWGLNTAMVIALAIGGWYFSSVNDNVTELTMAVNGLKTEVALLKQERKEISKIDTAVVLLKETVALLEKRLLIVETTRFTNTHGDELKDFIQELKDRVRDLEGRVRDLEGR